MFRKTKKFLLTSTIGLLLLCIVVFINVGVIMSRKSTEAISQIGMIYMSEVNRQLQEKFDAIVSLRLSQVEGIVRRTPPDQVIYDKEMKAELSLSAEVREFTFLGLCGENGNFETIYGEPVTLFDEEEFQTIMESDEKWVSSGYTKDEERVVLFMVPAAYPMKDGGHSTTLIVGLPMQDLGDAMVLDSDNALVYSHIIRRDGSFVVRSGEAYRDNYFTRVREIFSEYNGKTSEEYEQELRNAMANNSDYSALLVADGAHRHLYCSPLPGSEWYLVSVMPYGTLDDAINDLSMQRQNTMLVACGILLMAMLFIFIRYYKMTQQQVKELDEARREADRANHAKSEFLSSMSHDIRTPMNGIVGMTAIAMTNIDDTMRVRDCLKKITLSSKHLLGLINDVLDMSKIESGKLSLNIDLLSLRETMENIVNIVQPQIKEKQQHFDIFIRDIGAENVYCDSVRLNQILLNLLSNAVKFTPEGGTVNVFMSQEDSPKGHEFVRCHFRVRDNGIGMSEEFQGKIFDTFSREETGQVQKTEGTGLGMSITKYLVDMMGGTIVLKSAPGQGSEFHITLDLERADMLEQDLVLPPWNMLVVDNNEDLCQSAVGALKEIGVQADWALSGAKALEMIAQHHREHNDYYIILLDWKMPDMDGVQTTREIRKIVGDEVPILIISAYDWSDIEDEAREAGAHGFISKPLFKSNLYLGLRQFVDGSDGQAEENTKQKQEDFAGKRILLAEDNDLNWEIAEEILTEAGFDVEWAQNGQICVDKFSASAPGFYDVILMDIRMPVMNGYEAAEHIRALKRTDAAVPIIAMTADAFAEDIQHCLASGMNDHIAKPIDITKLMHLLEKYLN